MGGNINSKLRPKRHLVDVEEEEMAIKGAAAEVSKADFWCNRRFPSRPPVDGTQCLTPTSH